MRSLVLTISDDRQAKLGYHSGEGILGELKEVLRPSSYSH
jgi:hypothetical protein